MSIIERFWSKVDKRGQDECWPWTGTIMPTGYGRFHEKPYYPWLAHRFVYSITVGEIPAGMTIDHQCHNEADCEGGYILPAPTVLQPIPPSREDWP